MKNRALLRPFDLVQAEAGAAICWSHLDKPVTFVGRTTSKSIAIRQDNGFIETTCKTSLRMKPLFWKEGKPVYAGDRLWHTLSKRMLVVERLQEDADAEEYGYFYDTQGLHVRADLCVFEEPPKPLFILEGKPVNKGTRLWHNRDNKWVTVAGMYPFGDFIDEDGKGRSLCYCMWEKPKTTVVRYANVYRGSASSGRYLGDLFTTVADAQAVKGSKEGVGVARIEWQE